MAAWQPVRLDLTDAEWMSLIDGERDDGLQRCCANISALRDCLIGAARSGGEVHTFEVDQLRMTLGWVLDGHDIDGIPALVKVRRQLELQGKPPHLPQPGEA
jgi:hypothetical protein